MIGGKSEQLDACAASLVSPGAFQMLRAYGHFSDGRLWFPGAVSEQPAKYLRSMEIIGSELAAIRRREREAAQAK